MSPSTIASIAGWLLILSGMAVHVYALCLKDREQEHADFVRWQQERRERIERMP